MFAVLWVASEAMGGCRLDSVGPDPVTGDRVDSVGLHPGYGHWWRVDHHSADARWAVTWQFVLGGERTEVLPAGDTRLRISLTSGAWVEAPLAADAHPVVSDVGGLALTSYTASFALTESDVAWLEGSPVRAVQVARGAEVVMAFGARSAEWRTFPEQVRCLRERVDGA